MLAIIAPQTFHTEPFIPILFLYKVAILQKIIYFKWKKEKQMEKRRICIGKHVTQGRLGGSATVFLPLSSFLSAYHGKATTALYFGRISTGSGVIQFPSFLVVACNFVQIIWCLFDFHQTEISSLLLGVLLFKDTTTQRGLGWTKTSQSWSP